MHTIRHPLRRAVTWLPLLLAGALALPSAFAQDSAAGANRFGANPKAGPIGRSFQAATTGKPWAAPQPKR